MEREIKLEAGPSFRLPPLTGVAKEITARRLVTVRQRAIYLDTEDLRLARNGITLRHRTETARGKRQESWTLKLPEAADGVAMVRQEISWPGPPDAVPSEATALVRAVTRGASLAPVATVETQRSRVQLRDGAGRAVAEVDDDRVVAIDRNGRDSRFREIEVELADGAPPGILDAVRDRLLGAGAKPGSSQPKVFRALGARAQEPPDVVVPKLDRKATLRDVVAASIAEGVSTLVRHDPGIRLDNDIENVHKARVATRRLRSDLRTFRAVLDRGWANRIRGELRWLAAGLAEVRDADVLMEELRKQAASLPNGDAAKADAILAQLAADRQRAHQRLLKILDSDRHLGLLNDLTAAAANPPFERSDANPGAAARSVLPGLVRQQWKRLRRSVRDLGDQPSDEDLHTVRKRAKAVRYAAEVAGPVIGKRAWKLARAMENLQEVLGELHDAIVAEAWLRRAGTKSKASRALVAGELIELELKRQAAYRSAWPKAWRKAADKRLRAWTKS
jgi:CHAD domain-containing protein